MKLIYVWLENYNDRIVNQEFLFSPEFLIHYDNDWNELHIFRNKDYIKGFYGENVLDVAAIVGENGAGKTTVARCLYDICEGITPIDDEGDANRCAKIVIYLKEGCCGQKEKLLICYFLKRIFEKKCYGAKPKESGLELAVIQQYASKMGIDIGEAYGSAINYNFLIYSNIVCEIALFLNLFNCDNINVDFDEMEKNYQDIKSMGAFRTMMSQIADSDKKELVIKIRGINGLDIKILDDFFEIVDRKEPVLKDTQWYQQMKAFRFMYENRYGNLEIPDRVNGKHTELIDILMKEYGNPESFWGRMFKVTPNPMSSGEVALINIFSSIYKVMMDETEGSILLIVDEIDAFLHPKWQQDILMCMTEWINREKKFKKKKVQIILASHSPIILSDIPDDRVIYLKKLCRVVSKDNPTFGANISRLFYDSFFMDDGSIGAFSKGKIQAAADYIGNKECSVGKREAEYIIENIGEPFVKKKLQKDWEYKKFTGGYND